jgi:membrane associated rhomboid family serine protease
MIPLRDENPSGSTPIVTRFLIGINVVVFLYEILLGPDLRGFLFDWGFVPRRFAEVLSAGTESLLPAATTLVTSMFLHGGWAHLASNMWYLWIFGDNVEDRLGRGRFVFFYLASGVASVLVHFAAHPSSPTPTVGASGAIAGVLGAYLFAFPHARVITLIPFFPFFQVVALPALVVLGLWFVFQFFSGLLALAASARAGGVAWWAHIGGFAVGYLGMRLLHRRRR